MVNINMNKEFYVNIFQNSEDSKLILDLDKDPRIRYLSLEHPLDSKIVRSINIHGSRFFIGLNNQNRINSLELLFARENWAYSTSSLLRPGTLIKGAIEFVNVKSHLNEFDEMPLDVYADKDLSAVKIEINALNRVNSFWVSISDNCLVEILNNYLIGFWIQLGSY